MSAAFLSSASWTIRRARSSDVRSAGAGVGPATAAGVTRTFARGFGAGCIVIFVEAFVVAFVVVFPVAFIGRFVRVGRPSGRRTGVSRAGWSVTKGGLLCSRAGARRCTRRRRRGRDSGSNDHWRRVCAGPLTRAPGAVLRGSRRDPPGQGTSGRASSGRGQGTPHAAPRPRGRP